MALEAQVLSIHLSISHLNVPHYGPSDKTIPHRQHVGVLFWVCHLDVVQFDVQVLIHRMQDTCDTQIIL